MWRVIGTGGQIEIFREPLCFGSHLKVCNDPVLFQNWTHKPRLSVCVDFAQVSAVKAGAASDANGRLGAENGVRAPASD